MQVRLTAGFGPGVMRLGLPRQHKEKASIHGTFDALEGITDCKSSVASYSSHAAASNYALSSVTSFSHVRQFINDR